MARPIWYTRWGTRSQPEPPFKGVNDKRILVAAEGLREGGSIGTAVSSAERVMNDQEKNRVSTSRLR